MSSQITINGGVRIDYQYKSANYSITSADFLYLADGVVGTLPNGPGNNGITFCVVNNQPVTSTTVNTVSSQVFGNVVGTPTTYTIAGGEKACFFWNGVSWSVLK